MGLHCVTLNTFFVVIKFLNDEIHLSNEEPGNFYSCHFTGFILSFQYSLLEPPSRGLIQCYNILMLFPKCVVI